MHAVQPAGITPITKVTSQPVRLPSAAMVNVPPRRGRKAGIREPRVLAGRLLAAPRIDVLNSNHFISSKFFDWRYVVCQVLVGNHFCDKWTFRKDVSFATEKFFFELRN
ncbi:MAG: hypothetical protein ACRYGO_13270 [Janthinobacterium lividum]